MASLLSPTLNEGIHSTLALAFFIYMHKDWWVLYIRAKAELTLGGRDKKRMSEGTGQEIEGEDEAP